MKYMDQMSDEEIDKVTHLNANRLFQFDPFSVRPREQCTVGALRAEAGDWDVSMKATATRERSGHSRSSSEFATNAGRALREAAEDAEAVEMLGSRVE
jgi:hypothetical protein